MFVSVECVSFTFREVALALCSLMFVRFRDAGHWAHSKAFVKDMDAKVSQADRGEAPRLFAATPRYCSHIFT